MRRSPGHARDRRARPHVPGSKRVASKEALLDGVAELLHEQVHLPAPGTGWAGGLGEFGPSGPSSAAIRTWRR